MRFQQHAARWRGLRRGVYAPPWTSVSALRAAPARWRAAPVSYPSAFPVWTRFRASQLPPPTPPHPHPHPRRNLRPVAPDAASAAAAPTAPALRPRTWPTGVGIGVLSGFVGASAGVGGAVLSIPMMCRFVGLQQRVAAGTALFAVCAVAASGSYVFCSAHQVDIPAALCLSVSAACVAPLGVAASRQVSSSSLRRALGLFLLVAAPLMPVRGALERQTQELDPAGTFSLADSCLPQLVATGAFVGLVSGLLGVGGGTLFTPAIAFLAGTSYTDFHTVLGTSFLAMTLPAVIGAVGYWRLGQVEMALVPSLCLGTLSGATVGSNLALNVPEDFLRWGFAIFFSFLGWRLIRSKKPLTVDNKR